MCPSEVHAATWRVAGARKGRGWRRLKKDLTGYAFVAPWVVGFLWFSLYPFLASMYLSLTDYYIGSPAVYVGTTNFQRMFTTDRLFKIAVRVTLTYAVMAVPLGLVQGILIALLLNQKVRAIAFFRTSFYVPAMISSIGWMLVWVFILSKNGGLNWVLARVGIEGPSYLTTPKWALPSLVVMGLFSVGGSMLIILAALQGVPQHLYEAVEIDGGGELAKFRHVTLPQISPAIFFNLVMSLIGVLQSWMTSYVMTAGGPRHATLFYGLYLYRHAFQYMSMGYASALGWVAFVVILALTGLNFLGARFWVFYEAEPAPGG